MYTLQTTQAKNIRDHQHAGGLTARDPNRNGESTAQGAARTPKRAHSEASSPTVAANGAPSPARETATSESALPPKKRRINVEEKGDISTSQQQIYSRYSRHADVCYGCDLDVKTPGNTTRKGYRVIDDQRRTLCHFCFGNIYKFVGGYSKANYLTDAPALCLGMDRSRLVAIMSNAKAVKQKRKAPRDFTECVQTAKAKKTETIYGYDVSNPVFSNNLKAAFESCVVQHGEPGTSNWKHWKHVGFDALKATYVDFDKCWKTCTSLGNRTKELLAKLGMLG